MRIAGRRVPTWLLVACIAVLLLGVWRIAAAREQGATVAAPSAGRPNVVVIMTDDQTLSTLRFMPNVQERLVAQGTTFTDSIITLPVCCPARATFLTGQYAHNHGVRSNLPPEGGNDKLDHTNTLATWMDDAGYVTSHVGKYLNSYGQYSTPVQPPGWDRWFTTIDPSTYSFWDYEVLDGDQRRRYGSKDEDYQTDVMGAKVVDEVEALAGGDDPFFLVWSTLAPHNATGRDQTLSLMSIPAPRHRDQLAAEPLPQPPSFDEADVSDKPSSIRDNPPVDRPFADAFFHAYIESLLSVDEWVGRIVDALERTGRIEDTVIVFTSDNGAQIGEHRIGAGYKLLPYEESLLVPMVVRGPGFAVGASSSLPVTNLELAPTILHAAGASAQRVLDGYALQEVLAQPALVDGRATLIDNGVGGGDLVPQWEGVRTSRYTYVEYPSTGEVELYDRDDDPFQLESRHADPSMARLRQELAALLEQLRSCSGDACRAVRSSGR